MGVWSLQNPYHTSRFAPYVLFGVHGVANLRRMGSLLFRRHACNFFARVLWFLYTSLKNPCAAHLNIKLLEAIFERLVAMTSLSCKRAPQAGAA